MATDKERIKEALREQLEHWDIEQLERIFEDDPEVLEALEELKEEVDE